MVIIVILQVVCKEIGGLFGQIADFSKIQVET